MKSTLHYLRFSLLIIMTGWMLIRPAFADHPLVVGIPIQIQETGLFSAEESYTIVLRARDETSPMPTGTDGLEYTITAKRGRFLMPIPYHHEGWYRYTIHQPGGWNPNTHYDERIYDVTVFISQAANGVWEPIIEIKLQGASGKLDQVEFINHRRDSWLPLTGLGSSTGLLILGCLLVCLTLYLGVRSPCDE